MATWFRLSSWRILAGGSAGSGGGISAGVAAWWGISVPPLSNQGLAQTLYLLVAQRAEAVVWSVLITRLSALVLAVGVKSSFGETCCLLLIIQPWLLGRTTGANGTGDLQ